MSAIARTCAVAVVAVCSGGVGCWCMYVGMSAIAMCVVAVVAVVVAVCGGACPPALLLLLQSTLAGVEGGYGDRDGDRVRDRGGGGGTCIDVLELSFSIATMYPLTSLSYTC
jgi:hypothetical protein